MAKITRNPLKQTEFIHMLYKVKQKKSSDIRNTYIFCQKQFYTPSLIII